MGKRLRVAAILGGMFVGIASVAAGTAQETPGLQEPAVSGGPATFRKLTADQYRRSIADVFGKDVAVPGRFDPPLREEGLIAIGAGKVAVSSSGFEQDELRARQIAAALMAKYKREKTVPCKPVSETAFDKACAATFVGNYGRMLYRRPLSREESTSVLALAAKATADSGDFYKGLQVSLARMLASPNFLFRVEQGVPDPAARGSLKLDDYSLATRISFLLWDAAPDAELLDAAQSGALRTEAGLAAQADRLIASPRFADGVRAFFTDMFAYDLFDGLSKEQTIYPKYTSQLAKDAQEQALRTIVNHLVTERGDYRDLFTTRKTFINRNLGALYKIRISPTAVDGWEAYTFAPSEPREGILTLAAFLMLDPAHEGRSSPTIRGKAVREVFMCEPVPQPPAAVDFTAVNNTTDAVHKTARDRLKLHSQDPVCAGCHKITDPIGLALENYDAIGQFRTHENGAMIDASGEFEGATYVNALDLGRKLRESPAVSSCIVQRAYEYGVGRPVAEGDVAWLEYATQRFAGDRYAFPALLRTVATSKAFRVVAPEKPLPSAKSTKVALSR